MKGKTKFKLKTLLTIFVVTLLTSCISNIAFANTTTIQYEGNVTYGASKVGLFRVDGRRAFCMDHEKTSPPNGTSAEKSIYTNEDVIKCLYYGWEGAEVWSGFNGNSNYGIVATTLAIDHYVNGSNKTVARDFISFIDSAPKPEESLNFSENRLVATVQGNKQVTNQTEIKGTSGIILKFSIPDDVTVVCDNRNWSKTGGTVEVSNGDIIHFEAPLTRTGNWTSEQIPNSYVYNAILSRTSNNNLQRIVRLGEKDPGTYTNISIDFVATGSLAISKKDSKTGVAISNTVYDVKDTSGTIIGQIKTDSNGYGKLTGLVAGTYTLIETKANENYVIDSNPIIVTVKTGEISVNELTNARKLSPINVIKVDSRDNKTAISGVTFDLYSSEDNYKIKLDSKTTGKDGKITFEELRVGYTYRIKETKSNEWYELDGSNYDILLKPDQVGNLTVKNVIKKAKLQVEKKDIETNENLSGFEFTIYQDVNNNEKLDSADKEIQKLITKDNGKTEQSILLDIDKQYLIKETKAISDYNKTDEIKIVKLSPSNSSKTVSYTFYNEKKKGNLKINKIDKDNNKIGLGHIGFRLFSQEFNSYIKLDKKTGSYISIEKEKAEIFYTDWNGNLLIQNLRIGEYTLEEVEGEYNQWYNSINPINITITAGEEKNCTIENELKKGQIKVIKIDEENNEVKLEGVKFNVYADRNENGIADKDEYIDTLITNEKGEAITKAYAIRDYRKLILIETETNKGYELDNTPIKVTLKENEIKTIKFENKPIKTIVNPYKKDRDTNKPLAGAEFDIYKDTNENGKLDEKDKVVYHTVTKEDGYSEDIELYYGTYFVKEVVAPEGYTLDHIISTFSVTELNQKIEINFADKIIENNVNIYKVSKNDSIKYGIKKDEGVPDTYFVLYKIDKDGNIIDFAKDKFGNYIGDKIAIEGKEYYSVKTDKTGNVQVTVPYGSYLFKEIKSHDLFLKDSKDTIIDVLDDGKQVNLEFYNTAVNLELDISKTGINQAQPDDIIRYDFPNLINKSNVALDNFTWWDHLPSKYTKITKLYTGIWNEDLTFKVYYKTNKQDYVQYGLEYSTLVNNCIDFEKLELNDESNEYITDFKIEFGTIQSGFTFIEAPFIFTKVDSDVKITDEWTNKTKLTGQYTDINGNIVELEDSDEHTTITYGKELKITTFPRTGNDFDIYTIIIRALSVTIVLAIGIYLIIRIK